MKPGAEKRRQSSRRQSIKAEEDFVIKSFENEDSDATDDDELEREVTEADQAENAAAEDDAGERLDAEEQSDEDEDEEEQDTTQAVESETESDADDEGDDEDPLAEDDEEASEQAPAKVDLKDEHKLGNITIATWNPSEDITLPQLHNDDRKKRVPDKRAEIEVVSSDTDTSEDEHSRNTVGRIPMEWYEDYEHIGYDLNGKKISKPKQKDKLDKFLDRMENPAYGRTIYDPVSGKEIELTDEDIDMIKRIQGGQLPDAGINPYAPYEDFFTHEKMQTPVVSIPEPKRRFIPSKWEHKKIMKIVRSIRKGRIQLGPKEPVEDKFYDIWGQTEENKQDLMRHERHVSAPKLTLPKHDESYNPPPEYLPTAEEAEQWKQAHEDDREKNYLPQKFSSLRLVPGYDQLMQERFHRCLDLYLCPRARRVKLNIDPDSLLPKLPKPQDLQPFPSAISLTFEGHTSRVTSLSADPTGQWLASGSDDKTVRVWEVATGRCMSVLTVKAEINNIEWCPNPSISLVAVASGTNIYLINPLVASSPVMAATDELCSKAPASEETGTDKKAVSVAWNKASPTHFAQGHRFKLEHAHDVRQVAWHRKGNYFAAVMPEGASQSVCVHSLIRQTSQYPFRKKNHDIQRVLFHDKQPLFFVATKTHVRVYNLQTQTLVKKLITGVRWISSMALHPAGDNIIIGSYDRRLCWFDLDLSIKPYKTLRYHRFALRQVAYHRSYPLFASCCDDGSVHMFHGMVYNDLSKNPLIVPVKILKAQKQGADGLGVLDCQFHPTQPWIFTAGADGKIHLFT